VRASYSLFGMRRGSVAFAMGRRKVETRDVSSRHRENTDRRQ
jgi:hypothetical protein